MKLSPHRLTPALVVLGIRSLVGFSKPESPLVHPVLYHRGKSREASPKAISERTSYHGTWLAFHPYPQLIPALFNVHGFGPPAGVTPLSPWPRVDRPASRLFPPTDAPSSDSLSLRLAYA